MKKTVVGFDIGNSTLKVAMWKKQQLEVQILPLPENLIVDGVIKLPRLMIDFLKEAKKEYGIKSGPCALVVSDALCVCRSLSMPFMNERQLKMNLPFEFHDYITDEPENYVYDYAVQEVVRDEMYQPTELKLLGALISKAAAEEYVHIFKSAGFSLQTLIPKEMALVNLMRRAIADGNAKEGKDYCIVDFGYTNTDVYIMTGEHLTVLHTVPMGGADIDKVIAANENVDVFMAATYKDRNYNQVLEAEYCKDIFAKLTVEIMKVINFYYFNDRNRESTLDNIYFVGGISRIEALCESIEETTELKRHSITELFSDGIGQEAAANGLLALGALMQ